MQQAPEPERPAGPGRLERIVLPLVREPLFMPVTFTIAAHLALGVATVQVYLLRERAYVLLALLGAAIAGSVTLVRMELRDAGKPGPVLGWMIFTWVAAAVLTWALFDWL